MFRFLKGLFLVLNVIYMANMEACTGIKLTAKDGSYVHGRTLEFGMELDIDLAFIPRNYAFQGTTNQGTGLKYQSKYAAIGAISFQKIALLDAINEKGLAVGTFYFPGFAGYSNITSDNLNQAVSPLEFPNWIVTQFGSIEELIAALPNIVIAPTTYKEWGPNSPPFHYIVYDKEGNCLVIEPIDGKLVTYDNKIGTLTNAPAFDWHMNNLRNFINLTPYNVKPLKVDGLVLAPFGQGSGMVGLPGDFTPPSRFVRASCFAATAEPSHTAQEAVFQAFHILNQFDIPIGISREKVGEMVVTDYTMFTCVKDPQTLKYYFKTYEDQTIRMIDLNTFSFDSKSVKQANPKSKGQVVVDMSADLKP